ncbi:DUF6270 domain-containing protein [Leisingera sp. F5]|uniref:DUF6270 domain-containing protein n=1 Tax=Leisingera sp. F5 TaxID=1813816 RepID=UPI000ADD38C3|nr:DUF6270 domain-containing protein [Leisingera sp. F5]
MLNISILGSHVLKGAVYYLGDGSFSQKVYAPKISLASATGPKVKMGRSALEFSALDSFSRKVLARDFNKTLMEELVSAETDILLVDFFDEVFDYKKNIESRACLTASNYLARLNQDALFNEEWCVITQDSSDAWKIWEDGCVNFLEKLPVRIRLVLVELYIPDNFLDEAGRLQEYSKEKKEGINKKNELIRECYRRFKRLSNCLSVEIDRERIASQTPENMGVNPTNVSEDVYAYIASQLAAALHLAEPTKQTLEARVENLISIFDPIIGSQEVPTIAELHKAGVKYARKKDVLKAKQCERLISLIRNSSVPNSVEMGACTFGYGGIGVIINANCKIGDFVNIGSNVTLGGGRAVKDDFGNVRVAPYIEDRVYIATGAKVLGGIAVGHHSIIGANAVVTNNIPPFSVVGGIPGKVIATISRENLNKYSSYLYKGVPLEECARYMFGD